MPEPIDRAGLQVVEISARRGLEQYRGPWEVLLARDPYGDFFDTYEWLSTWLEFFWQDRPIAFLFVYRDGELLALLPLLSDEAGETWCRHTLSLPINHFSTRADLIGEKTTQGVLEALWGHLSETRRAVRLGLQSVATDSSLLPALEQVADVQRLRIQEWPALVCPLVRIEGDWDGYLASLSKHVRSEIRRKRRKFERAGDVELRIVTSPDDSRAAMEDILHIEERSWKEASQSSFTAVRGLADFYNTLSLRCARRGWLRNYILYVDDVPVAHMVGMVYRHRYYALKTSFDEHYSKLSPGAVLAVYVLEQAFAERLHVFDFLGLPSRWKDELANDVREHVGRCLFEERQLRCRTCAYFHNRLKPVIKNHLPDAIVQGRTKDTRSSVVKPRDN
jgi:CelD/BcsL family acetyltransferase involved in cellulose biosynthesis